MYLVNYVTETPIQENVFGTLAAKFNISASSVKNVSDLFSLLSSPNFYSDCILLDIESCFSTKNLTPFDLINTLSTLIECTVCRIADSKKPVRRSTKILIGVKPTTELRLIKGVKGAKINGFYPMGPDFTLNDKISCIQDTIDGKFHIPKLIKNNLARQKKVHSDQTVLTARQEQILLLIQQRGASNKVIAKILNIAESTVKLHISQIFKKYGVRNRTQLALFSK